MNTRNPWHVGTDPYKGDNNYHRCWGKIMRLLEVTGVMLDHDSITWLCEDAWGCSNEKEFYEKMRSMSKDELKEWAEKARKHKKGVNLVTDQDLLSVYT